MKKLKHLIGRGRQLAAERARKPELTDDHVHITNETVAARREEVLGSARKYIYPLGAPKHRVVKWSIGILVAAVVIFFSVCLLELYRFQSTSSFIYGVTQVIPFPVAIVGNHQIVSYNDYLFELRRYMHYYQTQQHADFNTKEGAQQLAVFKQKSMDLAIQNAYVQRLADDNHVSVSESDIDNAINLVRTQNRLGASEEVFESVLSEFWGWSVSDFRRELRQELLAQKVVDKLDVATHTRASDALTQLEQGADFATLAKQVSDDTSTKGNGGAYPAPIDRANIQLPPQIIDALFKLDPGHFSYVINTGYTLEIVKVNKVEGAQLDASHIVFNLQPISIYTAPLAKKEPAHQLIHV